VLRGELEAARTAAERSARYLKSSAGLQQIADHHFWAAIAAARGRDPGAASLLRRAIRRHRRWARPAPDNFRDRQFILEGERAWLDERTAAALSWFERAAEAARQAGHLAIEGLASERAAEAADALERRRAARFHRTEALAAWRSWGAIALADSLLERHPELALRSSEAGTGGATSLDLFTVVKSSQAISGAVQLPVLLDTLLGIVLENAGAERGVLLLKEGAGFLVQADGKVGEPASTMQATPLAAYDGAAHSVINYVLHSRESAVIADATADPAWAHDPYVKRAGARSVLCAPLLRQGDLTGVPYLENNATPGAFTAERLEILTLLSGQIAISLDNSQLVERLEDKVRERTGQLEARNQFIRRTFGRFLSDDIVDSLLDTSAGSHLGGEKRQVTILMADLRDFSVTAESLAPETVVTIINNYLGAMTEVIMAHQGTIDEFIGDAILAIFGAPTLRDDDAERAVACALAMQHTMTEVNARNRAAGLPEVSMGIGLHTGEVVVGSIGSEKRAKYGVVGAAVNLASRIESYTLPGQILMSESTRSAVSAPLRIDGERTVRPKGSPAPIVLYDVGGIGGAWQVELNRQKSDPLLTLPEPVPVAWAPLEGKSMTRQPQPASIVALAPSQESCRIVLDAADAAAPEPLTNVWLTLDPSAADAGDGRSALFGKVLLSDPLGFTVRFSSVPEWARAALQPYIADDDERSDADTANTAVSPNSLRSPESRP
jgi:class 3 adenylate cyclase